MEQIKGIKGLLNACIEHSNARGNKEMHIEYVSDDNIYSIDIEKGFAVNFLSINGIELGMIFSEDYENQYTVYEKIIDYICVYRAIKKAVANGKEL